MLLAAACARATGPPARWLELASDFRARDLVTLARSWERAAGRPEGATELDHAPGSVPGGVRVSCALGSDAWTPVPGDEALWRADVPEGAARRARPASARLSLGATEVASGRFTLADDVLTLRVPVGAGPPEDARLELVLEQGESLDGRHHVRLGDRVVVGVPVWSGTSEAFVLDAATPNRLTFHLLHTHASPSTPATFRLTLAGGLLLERTLTSEADEEWISLVLPAGRRGGAELSFAFDGAPGLGVVAGPVLGPVELGRRDARPWPGARPDLVLVVADTFRADNLALYGGAPELTPRLNALAADSLCFLGARASSSWTLPSMAALLTGLYPPQHDLNRYRARLAEDVETLAERLARAGYRTGAVSDTVFFSERYGLAQGFESFRYRGQSWSLAGAVEDARAFLAGDDGRPVFLVLHTHRAHTPYRSGTEESRAAWEALVQRTAVEFDLTARPPPAERPALFLAMREPLRELYEDGVHALDAGLGELLANLEEERVLPNGVLVFTADHGEAFGENGVMFHGGELWDSRLRVPLLVHGAGLGARALPWTVSNADLAPTLAALAGLRPDPGWSGSSLLAVERDRPVLSFQLHDAEQPQIAVIEGSRKVIARGLDALGACEIQHAFELATDPGEERDLAGEVPWPAELLRAQTERLRGLQVDRHAALPFALRTQEQAALRALGYAGEE